MLLSCALPYVINILFFKLIGLWDFLSKTLVWVFFNTRLWFSNKQKPLWCRNISLTCDCFCSLETSNSWPWLFPSARWLGNHSVRSQSIIWNCLANHLLCCLWLINCKLFWEPHTFNTGSWGEHVLEMRPMVPITTRFVLSKFVCPDRTGEAGSPGP